VVTSNYEDRSKSTNMLSLTWATYKPGRSINTYNSHHLYQTKFGLAV